jgi:hypothetical protein
MTMTFVRVPVMLAALFAPVGVAIAATPLPQDAPPPVPVVAPVGSPEAGAEVPDPERLAIAQQIILIVLPPDHAEAMTERMEEAILRPMIAQASTRFQGDPGVTKLWDAYVIDMTRVTRDA